MVPTLKVRSPDGAIYVEVGPFSAKIHNVKELVGPMRAAAAAQLKRRMPTWHIDEHPSAEQAKQGQAYYIDATLSEVAAAPK